MATATEKKPRGEEAQQAQKEEIDKVVDGIGKPVGAGGNKGRAPKKQASASYALELPVSFGGVSVGDETARVGINVSRGNIALGKADKDLCGRRLVGRIIARPEGSGATQEGLFEQDGDIALQGIFDVKKLSVDPKNISTGLTFSLNELSDKDRENITYFAKREGMLLIEQIQDIPAKEGRGSGDGESDDGDDE